MAADIERAKVLISKRTSLRILAGERGVKLKPVNSETPASC
jgi:hypothetical protein